MQSPADPASKAGAGRKEDTPHNPRVFHRLGDARRAQSVSRRHLARRMNVELAVVIEQEESSDLPLSIVYDWQRALGIPVSDLLVSPPDGLSQPLEQRAQLLRLMKYARYMLERSNERSIRTMAQNMINLLLEMMPELQTVEAWHATGRQRGPKEPGITALRSLSEDVFLDPHT